MVAQHGQDPSLQQLAVPGGTEKMEPDSKRGRNSHPPRMQKRGASGNSSQDSASSRRSRYIPLRYSVWSSKLGSETGSAPSQFDYSLTPPKVRLDESGWTISKVVEQMECDRDFFRRDIQSLQDTIRDMYTSQQTNMSDLTKLEQAAQLAQSAFTERCLQMKNFKDRLDHFEAARAAETPDDVVHRELESMKAKLDMLQKFTEKHDERESRMTHYLETLDAQRPMEGQTVIHAFKAIAQELEDVKRQVQEQHGQMFSVSNYVKEYIATGSNKGMTDVEMQEIAAIQSAVNNLSVDIGTMKAAHWSWEGRCHCDHVDSQLAQLIALSEQVQHLQMIASSPPVPAAYPAPRRGACGAFSAGGGCGDSSGPGGDGDVPKCFAASRGGNGECHCWHVSALVKRVDIIEAARRQNPEAERRAPLIPGERTAYEPAAGHHDDERTGDLEAPLRRRPLGLLAGDRLDKQIFDDKMAAQNEMRWDGGKGGPAWKSRVQSYFWSKVPALLDILKWAEKHDKTVVTDEAFNAVVSHFMDEYKQQAVSAAIWGFLSACLSGSAETIFRSAEDLNGIDAWRRVVRIIDSGLPLRLEELRGEVRMLHTRPMKDLEQVAAGVAEFEAKIKEYRQAGGKGFDGDHEMKSDLLAILPPKLREDHLLTAAGKESYIEFRDLVLMQTSRILFNRRRGGGGGVHGIDFEPAVPPKQEAGNADDAAIEDILITVQNGSREDVLAAVQRYQRRANPANGRRQQRPPPKSADAAGTRPPRKCPNCGKEHVETRCPHPAVAVADRPCWTCGKKGHSGRDCPQKIQRPQSGSVKALEDAPRDARIPFFGDRENYLIDDKEAPGFYPVRPRPAPRQTVLGDFVKHKPVVVHNSFSALESSEEAAEVDDNDCNVRRTPAVAHRRAPTKLKPKFQELRGVHGAIGVRADEPAGETPSTLGVPASRLVSVDRRPQKTRRETLDVCKTLKGASDFDAQFPELSREVDNEMQNINAILAQEEMELQLCEDESDNEEEIMATEEKVVIRAAMDSGSVASVINPEHLPSGVNIKPNTSGRHFTGAGVGSTIKKHGSCVTMCKGKVGAPFGCKWQAADVARPLQSVSDTCGPCDGPGVHEVLFTNRKCYVVPPGMVSEIMARVKPITEYDRVGGLYLADLTLSSFGGQGVAK